MAATPSSPTTEGPFSFVVELTNVRTGEVSHQRSPVVVVRVPDAIALRCLSPIKGAAFEPCGLHALEGAPERVQVAAEIGGRVRPLRSAMVNGRRLEATVESRRFGDWSFSWSDLSGEETAKPGVHRFVIEALGLHAATTVETR